MKRALICGVSGQDGGYLAKLLADRGYSVFGSSRDAEQASFSNLVTLGIRERVTTLTVLPSDFRSVIQALIDVEPTEVYHLAGQSSVGRSFSQPIETLESISTGTLNFLEAIRMLGAPTRFYSAGSSECFGDTRGRPATELTPFAPRSPYGVAKAAAYWAVANYREAYDLFACTGLLFNHESPLRSERFVTQKIVRGACRIARERTGKLELGNLDVQRDWGWAPDYVVAMWKMLQLGSPRDFVIATGVCNSLRTFVARAFECVELNWEEYVQVNEALLRPTDIAVSYGDASQAREVLGWEPTHDLGEIVEAMVQAELRRCGVTE